MTELQEVQRTRFKNRLNEIFSESYTSKLVFSDEATLVSARINTNETLDNVQLDMLTFEADSWHMTMQISRSGAGLKIEFNYKDEE